MRFKLASLTVTTAILLGAASASAALPEFYKGGSPNTQNIGFTGSSSLIKFQGIGIECASSTSVGKISGTKVIKSYKIKFIGCQAPRIGLSCQTSQAMPGVLKTKSLKGELVYSSETPGGALTATELFQPQTTDLRVMLASCGPHRELKVTFTGSVIGEPEPINVEQHTSNRIFREKPGSATCSQQQFLYVSGTGPCLHLDTAAGTEWIVDSESLTYSASHKIEVRG